MVERRKQVPLRIPESLRAKLAATAKDAGKSMNAEIIYRLEKFDELEAEAVRWRTIWDMFRAAKDAS